MDRNERKRASLSNKLAKKAFSRIYENIEDAVVPRTEDFIFDLFSSIITGFSNLVIGGFESLIYEEDSGRPSSGRRGEHDYMRYYGTGRHRSASGREKKEKRQRAGDYTDGLISCRNYNEIYYDNHPSADRLLRKIRRDAVEYDGISIENVYEILKKTGSDPTDGYYGWVKLDYARVQPVGPGKYWIKLPEPEELK